jgi:hypothetical protein
MVILSHNMLMQGGYYLFHWTKVRCDQIVTQSEIVATLALGLRPRQGSCEVAGLEVDPGVTSHAPGSAKGVRE